jgi:hypothetical protein
VVRDGHARLTPVKIASDNGLRVAIESGLQPTDKVVLHPASLVDGQEVKMAPPSEDKEKP